MFLGRVVPVCMIPGPAAIRCPLQSQKLERTESRPLSDRPVRAASEQIDIGKSVYRDRRHSKPGGPYQRSARAADRAGGFGTVGRNQT